MKFSDKTLSGILAVLLVAGVFAWVAWANTDPAQRSDSTMTPASRMADCPACPAMSTTVRAVTGSNTCLSLAGTAIHMDSPAVLLAKAEAIGLSEAQKKTLQGIILKSREDALAVLTPEQKAAVGQISAEPVVIGAILPESQTVEPLQDASLTTSDVSCGADEATQ